MKMYDLVENDLVENDLVENVWLSLEKLNNNIHQ